MSKFLETMGLDPSKIKSDEALTGEILSAETQVGDALAETMAQTENQKELLNDIEYSKGNIKDIIDNSRQAIDSLMVLAKGSESPRAFEVLSTMMKTYTDINKDYIHIAEKKKYVKEELPSSPQTNNITNNNLIVSTSDILKMMKGNSDASK